MMVLTLFTFNKTQCDRWEDFLRRNTLNIFVLWYNDRKEEGPETTIEKEQRVFQI